MHSFLHPHHFTTPKPESVGLSKLASESAVLCGSPLGVAAMERAMPPGRDVEGAGSQGSAARLQKSVQESSQLLAHVHPTPPKHKAAQG